MTLSYSTSCRPLLTQTHFLWRAREADQALWSGLGETTKPSSLVQTAVRDMPTKPLGLRPSGLVGMSLTLVWTNPSQTSGLYSLNEFQ